MFSIVCLGGGCRIWWVPASRSTRCNYLMSWSTGIVVWITYPPASGTLCRLSATNSKFKDSTAVARDSCSRIFATVVNSCAFVNGGQHLFFCKSAGWWFSLFIAVGRVLLQRLQKGPPTLETRIHSLGIIGDRYVGPSFFCWGAPTLTRQLFFWESVHLGQMRQLMI